MPSYKITKVEDMKEISQHTNDISRGQFVNELKTFSYALVYMLQVPLRKFI